MRFTKREDFEAWIEDNKLVLVDSSPGQLMYVASLKHRPKVVDPLGARWRVRVVPGQWITCQQATRGDEPRSVASRRKAPGWLRWLRNMRFFGPSIGDYAVGPDSGPHATFRVKR